MYRTKTCGELNITNVNETIELAGWIQKIRNLGAMIFIDLRDQFGITQIVINDEELQKQAKELTTESCIHISGKVVERSNKNTKIPTGEIEVIANEIEILGKCKNVLPFEINTDQEVREDLRLEYRFLDLRNEEIHKKIVFRSKVLKFLRDKMDSMNFTEVQTPILANSSPEGARDFLVPSRLHPGEFYALPQAPQQFKQLLMISGFDKYYQIAPCFRDEDPRADRSPGEFYQLDFEMEFATQEDVLNVLEEVATSTFKEFTEGKKISDAPFERIPFKVAMDKYGTDKPDLRNPLVIDDVTDAFVDSDFKVFKGKTVKAIKINAKDLPRKFFDQMGDFAINELGLKGLAWVKANAGFEMSGSIARFVTGDVLEKIKEICDLKEEDALFFVADEYKKACKDAGDIRIELGKRLDLIEKDAYRFCFIVDFPMYELDDDGKIEFSHNPFSMPVGGLDSLLNKDPLDVIAYQFDLVGNGYELASGAVRNHDTEVMVKAFEIAGYTEEDVKKRFGSLFNAFSYGAPPHAGAAPGIDRMIMLLLEESNIREVIAFPKNSKARDLLMRAPSVVNKSQLDDVHIRIKEEDLKKDE